MRSVGGFGMVGLNFCVWVMGAVWLSASLSVAQASTLESAKGFKQSRSVQTISSEDLTAVSRGRRELRWTALQLEHGGAKSVSDSDTPDRVMEEAKGPTAPVWVQMGEPEFLGRVIAPEWARSHGWDRSALPAAVLAEGEAWRYHVSLKLLRGAAQTRWDERNGLSLRFAQSNQTSLGWTMPDARIVARVHFSARTSAAWLPDYEDEFDVIGTGLFGEALTQIVAQQGRLEVLAADTSGVRFAKVDVSDWDIVRQIAVFLGQGSRLDEFATEIANRALQQYLSTVSFREGLKKLLRGSLETPVRAIFEPWEGFKAEAALAEWSTESGRAQSRWELGAAQELPPETCASGLMIPRNPRIETPESWVLRPGSDELALAFSTQTIELALSLQASQGGLCDTIRGEVAGARFAASYRPVGRIELTPVDASQDVDVNLSLAMDVGPDGRSFPAIRSKGLSGALKLRFRPEASTTEGLVARLQSVELVSLQGALRYAGVPLPLQWARERIASVVERELMRSIGKVSLLDARLPLGPRTWGSLDIVPPLLVHDRLIETRFRWKETP